MRFSIPGDNTRQQLVWHPNWWNNQSVFLWQNVNGYHETFDKVKKMFFDGFELNHKYNQWRLPHVEVSTGMNGFVGSLNYIITISFWGPALIQRREKSKPNHEYTRNITRETHIVSTRNRFQLNLTSMNIGDNAYLDVTDKGYTVLIEEK